VGSALRGRYRVRFAFAPSFAAATASAPPPPFAVQNANTLALRWLGRGPSARRMGRSARATHLPAESCRAGARLDHRRSYSPRNPDRPRFALAFGDPPPPVVHRVANIIIAMSLPFGESILACDALGFLVLKTEAGTSSARACGTESHGCSTAARSARRRLVAMEWQRHTHMLCGHQQVNVRANISSWFRG
jgi:hypothetical protein